MHGGGDKIKNGGNKHQKKDSFLRLFADNRSLVVYGITHQTHPPHATEQIQSIRGAFLE